MNDSIDLGGSGGSAFAWGAQGTQPGASVTGKILGLAEVQATEFQTGKPETWDNGDPKMQYRVSLQTDLRDPANPTDDGRRDVYLDGSRKLRDNGTKSRLCAVLEAVRAVTGGTAMQVGGFLRLTWVSGMGFSGDPRNYEAMYQPPTVSLGQPAQPAQPVAVPQGQPATQQVAQAPTFAQQQAQAYGIGGQAVSNPFGAPAQVVSTATGQPVVHQVPVAAPAAQGGPVYVNRQTGEIASAETVAAVVAAGMQPEVVFAVAQ